MSSLATKLANRVNVKFQGLQDYIGMSINIHNIDPDDMLAVENACEKFFTELKTIIDKD
jgi:hypothetical protein